MTEFSVALDNLESPEVKKELLLNVVRLQDEDIYNKVLEINKKNSLRARLLLIGFQLMLLVGITIAAPENMKVIAAFGFVGWCVFSQFMLNFNSPAISSQMRYVLGKFKNKEQFMKNFAMQYMLSEGIENFDPSHCSMSDHCKNAQLNKSLKVFNEHLDDYYKNSKESTTLRREFSSYIEAVFKRVERRREVEKDNKNQLVIDKLRGEITKQDILTYWKD